MPLLLNNAQQETCISPAEAIEVLEHGYKMWDQGHAIRRGTTVHILPTLRPNEFFMNYSMEGGLRAPGYYALRFHAQVSRLREPYGTGDKMSYTYEHRYDGGLVLLFSTDTAELLAIMNHGFVEHLRVAASAAIGAKYLARHDSHVLGIIGSGGMARTFAMTMPAVRPIERIVAWSPTREHLDAFCEEMQGKLDCEVVPLEKPEAVCREADILCACTSAHTPVVEPEWIRPGMHLDNVLLGEFERVYAKVDVVGLLVRKPPSRLGGFEDADYALRRNMATYMGGTPEERAKVPITRPNPNPYPNARYVNCVNWDTGEVYERGRNEITLLANCSYGNYPGDLNNSAGPQGIQFATVGGRMYENARKLNAGTELPRELFLEDTYTHGPGAWRLRGGA